MKQVTKKNEPVLFDVRAIAGLLFKEQGVNILSDTGMLQFGEAITTENERAQIIIGLYTPAEDHFELRFVVLTNSGKERMSVFDKIENLENFQLKKWMYAILCDEETKRELIEKFPEEYEFDETYCLE